MNIKRYSTPALLILGMLVIAAPVLNAQPELSADEAAIRENIKHIEDGWNTKSGTLFAKPFAEDADYVVINGSHIKGRAVIESQHKRIFETIFKDTTLKLNVKQIRFIRPEVAVVHVEVTGTAPPESSCRMQF